MKKKIEGLIAALLTGFYSDGCAEKRDSVITHCHKSRFINSINVLKKNMEVLLVRKSEKVPMENVLRSLAWQLSGQQKSCRGSLFNIKKESTDMNRNAKLIKIRERSKMKTDKIIFLVATLMAFLLCSACDDGELKSDTIIGLDVEVVGVPVIYETDMTLDVDDVGALAVLHGLQMEGKVTILGISYNETHPLAPAAIDAINTYYNCGTIPIGKYTKILRDPDPSDYYSARTDDVDNMTHDLSDNSVVDAVELYKQILANQLDSSVVVISVGFLNNLYDLLKDPEGFMLVENKVRLLAVMGGLHNDGFNFVRHNLVSQTQYVIENWPGPLVTTHVGGDMITGETLTSRTPATNPVRKAYELEWGVGPNKGRSSWDQVTTMYAIFGTQYFIEDWEGNGSLPNGYSWDFSKGYRGYAAPIDDRQVEQKIERLMTLTPFSGL